jgi:hypothetical protein
MKHSGLRRILLTCVPYLARRGFFASGLFRKGKLKQFSDREGPREFPWNLSRRQVQRVIQDFERTVSKA